MSTTQHGKGVHVSGMAPSSLISNVEPPVIIGIYGLPASGKTHLLNELRKVLDKYHFKFYDGSEVIERITDGGLAAFKQMSNAQKAITRTKAIKTIKAECTNERKTGVVAGHFMLMSEDGVSEKIDTPADWETYTHIIYLNTPVENIMDRTKKDSGRPDRKQLPKADLQQWQDSEKTRLRKICYENRILFAVDDTADHNYISKLINRFREGDPKRNTRSVLQEIDQIMSNHEIQPQTVLLFDADKTLGVEDASYHFWMAAKGTVDNSLLNEIFNSSLGYSYLAFEQAMLLYEELNEEKFLEHCKDVASYATLRPEFVELLREAAKYPHVAVVVITSGIRLIWDMVLERERLGDKVKVIGGCRLSDNYVVTPTVKGAAVKRLQSAHKATVWAFGDSEIDLPMLKNADHAFVVVGPGPKQQKAMWRALQRAVDIDGLEARQLLFPETAIPWLNTRMLPITTLEQVRESIFGTLELIEATDTPSALVLQTPMRNSALSGNQLRQAHDRCGWYLAIHHVTQVLGTEKYTMYDVHQNETTGWRLKDEDKTVIIPIMRGGEPMAFGVSDAFPKAVFHHAKEPDEVLKKHLEGMKAVILVDAVINEGGTIAGFVKHIRQINTEIDIVVMAGVVQRDAVHGPKVLTRALSGCGKVTLIALRTSERKYKGQGATDTGDRLFNTTHILKEL
ncbi:hypothetical protein D0864_06095 [Hortaea werneckii]|uniref:Phosphoribosyltransferase domain-containing protein n=1 Tax=Hortaea werneckii TaxID=91943 RepID=A0A3M7FR14_HORWE|nr:hypothetical protein KC323_g6143 [Hortaea werneckii]KAI6864002.1 hypothetical protein KC338_g5671 [Hortaea werneckii]KAI7619382.1 hypothetical protein KC346_g4591 [Hortaea werneckii]KAI7708803.1 hypothetical protein KC322_g4934 [Hortaea werneckii]RMY91350.1 hypothetical protein D0864_06095 [Hortaea werneckii]